MRDLNMFGLGDLDREHYEACFSESELQAMPKPGTGRERYAIHAYIAETFNGNPLVKTHNNFKRADGECGFNIEITKSIIYIVRNPLDMVISYADHYGGSADQVIEASESETNSLLADKYVFEQYLGSWRSHVANWVTARGVPKILLRYEDMVRDPKRAFSQLIDFLKLEKDEKRLDRAVENSSFDSLRHREEAEGFVERSPYSERFFRKGTFGGWRGILTKDQAARIISVNGAIMQKLGYIDGAGNVRF